MSVHETSVVNFLLGAKIKLYGFKFKRYIGDFYILLGVKNGSNRSNDKPSVPYKLRTPLCFKGVIELSLLLINYTK